MSDYEVELSDEATAPSAMSRRRLRQKPGIAAEVDVNAATWLSWPALSSWST